MKHSKAYSEALEDFNQLKAEEEHLWELLGKAWARIAEAEKTELELRKRHAGIKAQRETAGRALAKESVTDMPSATSKEVRHE